MARVSDTDGRHLPMAGAPGDVKDDMAGGTVVHVVVGEERCVSVVASVELSSSCTSS